MLNSQEQILREVRVVLSRTHLLQFRRRLERDDEPDEERIANWRNQTLRLIAIALIKTGYIDTTLEVTKQITNEWYVVDIGELLAEAGETEQALALIDTIATTHSNWVFATGLMRIGEVDRALTVTHTMRKDGGRRMLLPQIVEKLARVGRISDALTLLDEIDGISIRASALINLALIQAEQREQSEAIKLLEKSHSLASLIDKPLARGNIYLQLGEALAKLGLSDRAVVVLRQALAIIREYGKPQFRDHAVHEVAAGLIKANAVEEALEVVDLSGGSHRGTEYFFAALAAKHTVLAIQLADEIKNTSHQERAWNSIVRAIAAEQPEQALSIAQKIVSPDRRWWAMRNVATVFAHQGQIARALQLPDFYDAEEFTHTIADWATAFEMAQQGLSLKVLKEIAQIIGQYQIFWRDVAVILHRIPEPNM